MKQVILVIGLARGGTTAVSSFLGQLGYCLSVVQEGFRENAQYPGPEGGYLAYLLDMREYNTLHALINNAEHDLCFKRPDFIKHLRFLKNLHPGHRVVFVSRDPEAIARRRCMGSNIDLNGMINTVRKEYSGLRKVMDVVHKRGCTSLTVSYEQLMVNTRPELLRIATFAHRQPDNVELDRLAAFMKEKRRIYRFRHNEKRLEGNHARIGGSYIGIKMKRFFPKAPTIAADLTVRKVVLGSTELKEGEFRQFNLETGPDDYFRVLLGPGTEGTALPASDTIALETSDGFARTYENEKLLSPDKEDWMEAIRRIGGNTQSIVGNGPPVI